MKKMFGVPVLTLGALALGMSMALHAEEAKKTNVEPQSKATDASAQAVDKLGLAHQLAAYGDANKDPLALTVAARMLKEHGAAKDLEAQKTSTGEGKTEDAGKGAEVDMTADGMLARAKALAEDNEAMLAMIQSVEGLGTRGAGYIRHHDRVLAGRTDVYNIVFQGDRPAAINVIGDGDTDLDLYVYDENGNPICSDTDGTDQMVCGWEPAWTGPFRVEIQNLGSISNRYVLLTN